MERLTLKFFILSIICLVVGYITVYNFAFSDKPEYELVNTECDYEGIRQASTLILRSDSLPVKRIVVSINQCGPDTELKKKQIFSAVFRNQNIRTEWLSFDTLQIKLPKDLEPDLMLNKLTFVDPSLNVHVLYVEM